MKDFNLVLSTGRNYERQADCELWFQLLALGDETPIISRAGVPGLMVAKTSAGPRKLVARLKNILATKDPDYVHFISKIYPIDRVVESEIDIIRDAALELVANSPLCQDPTSSYRVAIRKRLTQLRTDEVIPAIAGEIQHPVSLKAYDWIIQIEIIGGQTGIAILTKNDIFMPKKKKS